MSAAGGLAVAVGLHRSRATAQEKIQAKAGQAVARAYPYTAGIEDLIRRTNQGTGGRVDIQFFPDAQLGNERDLFEGLRLGTVQIAVGATGVLAGFAPEVQLLDLPFLYKDSAHIYKAADTVGWDLVKALPVFRWLAATGGVAEPEMLRTFNCGIGMIVVVEARAADQVAAILKREGESVVHLGELVAAAKGKPRVTYTGRLNI